MDADLTESPTPSPEELVAQHLARRPDVDVVAPGLATGGDLHPDPVEAADEIDRLVELGVTHILDVREEWSDAELVARHAPDITYVHLGVDDAGRGQPDEWFDAGIALAAEVGRADGLLLAHCHMGINRGPSMAFAILLSRGAEPVAALDAIRTARPVAAIGYAAEALDHHHRRTGAPEEQRLAERRAVAGWFRANHLDVATIVRGIRDAQGGTTFR